MGSGLRDFLASSEDIGPKAGIKKRAPSTHQELRTDKFAKMFASASAWLFTNALNDLNVSWVV